MVHASSWPANVGYHSINAMSSFSFEAMVRGYHEYQGVWAASIGKELPCKRERGNANDSFAIAVEKDGRIVGHVPRKISSTCSLFLFSADLPQGGLTKISRVLSLQAVLTCENHKNFLLYGM